MGSQYAGTESFPIDYTIPDDGDERDAASVNVALEALGDRTVWLKARGVKTSYDRTFDDAGLALYQTESATFDIWLKSEPFPDPPSAANGDPYLATIDGNQACALGDELLISVSGTWAMEGASGAALRLRVVDDEDGVATETILPGARVLIPPGDDDYGPFAIVAKHVVTAAGQSRVFLDGRVDTASPGVNRLVLFDALSITMLRVRSKDPFTT